MVAKKKIAFSDLHSGNYTPAEVARISAQAANEPAESPRIQKPEVRTEPIPSPKIPYLQRAEAEAKSGKDKWEGYESPEPELLGNIRANTPEKTRSGLGNAMGLNAEISPVEKLNAGPRQNAIGSTSGAPGGFAPSEYLVSESPESAAYRREGVQKINELQKPVPTDINPELKSIHNLETIRDTSAKSNQGYLKGVESELGNLKEKHRQFGEAASGAFQDKALVDRETSEAFEALHKNFPALSREEAADKISVWQKLASGLGALAGRGTIGQAVHQFVPTMAERVDDIQRSQEAKYQKDFQKIATQHNLSMGELDNFYNSKLQGQQANEKMFNASLEILKAQKEQAMTPAASAEWDLKINAIEQGLAKIKAQDALIQKQYEATQIANQYGLVTEGIQIKNPVTGRTETIVPRNAASEKAIAEVLPKISLADSNLQMVQQMLDTGVGDRALVNSTFKAALANMPFVNEKDYESLVGIIYNSPDQIPILRRQLEQYAQGVISTNSKLPTTVQEAINQMIQPVAQTSGAPARRVPAAKPGGGHPYTGAW